MKKRTVLAIALVFLVLLLLSGCAASNTDYAKQGVVLMVGGDDMDDEAATGFVMGSRDGSWYVVTNYRIDEDNLDRVYLWRSEQETYSAVQVLALEDYGVTVQKILGNPKGLKPLIVNADNDVSQGDELTIIGFSGETVLTDQDAGTYVNQVRTSTTSLDKAETFDGVRVYMYDASLTRRSEGAPVLDESGLVVGVNVYLGEGEYGAVDIAHILPYLKSAGIQVDTGMSYSTRLLLIILGAAIAAALLIVLVARLRTKKTYKLVGVSGLYAGKTIRLTRERVLFGRDPMQCSIIYPPETRAVSRRHCEIYYDGNTNRYILVDLSSQGTFFDNGQRLEKSKPYVLGDGLRFYLADKNQMFVVKK